MELSSTGPVVLVLLRALRQPQQHVQVRHGVRRNLDAVNVAPHFLPQQQELFILHLAGTFVRPRMVFSICSSSGVTKRSAFTSVCLRW